MYTNWLGLFTINIYSNKQYDLYNWLDVLKKSWKVKIFTSNITLQPKKN